MPAKGQTFPWPVDHMRQWYEQDGLTLREIADRLSSPVWQEYWQEHLGRRYCPGQKIVNKVAKREKFAMRKTGAPRERNGNWKGGIRFDDDYVLVIAPEGHPHSTAAGYIRLHRLVMEEKLGRYLEPNEVVHHIDGNRANNHPDNLEVFEDNATHISETMKGKVPSSRIAAAHQARMLNLKAGSRNGKRIEHDAQASPQTHARSIA